MRKYIRQVLLSFTISTTFVSVTDLALSLPFFLTFYIQFFTSVRCRLNSLITESTHLDHRFPLHEAAQFKWHGAGGRTVEKTIRCDLHLVESFDPILRYYSLELMIDSP